MPRYALDTSFGLGRLKAYLRLDVGTGDPPPLEAGRFRRKLERVRGRARERVREARAELRRERQRARRLEDSFEIVPAEPTLDHPAAPNDLVDLYLDLIQRALWDRLHDDRLKRKTVWPATAHTMVTHQNMHVLRSCIEDVLTNDVTGDLIEAGVWRGGTTIFMRAVLKAHGVEDRTVWVADSFEGLPLPNVEKYPEDGIGPVATLHQAEELAVSLHQVKSNFSKYGLLDDQVRFLQGWFSETLATAPIERLAVIRLDGDMYESTMDSLTALYPKLSPGGYLIVDDYEIPACAKAVHDYREENGIGAEIRRIDTRSVYWQNPL